MNGRIVHTPSGRHVCDLPQDSEMPAPGAAPRLWRPGTVWRCDGCWATWVVVDDALPAGHVNRKGWAREGRAARWWRESRNWHSA